MTANMEIDWDQPYIPGPVKWEANEREEIRKLALKLVDDHFGAISAAMLRGGTTMGLVEACLIGLQYTVRLRPKMPPRGQDPYTGHVPTTEAPKPED